jgi:pimeloyl-ACP methyl ester carboxylesterase
MTTSNANTATRPHERHIATPHGQVYAAEIPGDDPPLVLMHGFPDDHRIYDRLLARLSPRRTVAFDFVGYGRSERTDGADFSANAHAAQITAVLDALRADRAVLVGHDASGPDAVAYTTGHPERVAHLVLLNTVWGHQPSMRWPEMTRLFSDPQLKILADDLVGDPNQLLWLLGRWGDQMDLAADDPCGIVQTSILPQFYGDEHQPDAVASVRAWCAELPDALDRHDALTQAGALAHLEVPVSIIWGRKDRYLNPSLAREIAALFEQPSVHLVTDAGHYPQYDQPDQVAELLKNCETV